jgi:hypothetical protein
MVNTVHSYIKLKKEVTMKNEDTEVINYCNQCEFAKDCNNYQELNLEAMQKCKEECDAPYE